MKKQYGILAGCTVLFMILSYEIDKQFKLNHLIIPRNELQWNNLIQAWLPFLLVTLILPILCYLPFFKFRHLILRKECTNPILIVGLFLSYIVCIFYRGVTTQAVFDFVFYLLMVGVSEELIFRGILYNLIKLQSYKAAVIISGALWGMMHYAPGMILNGILGGILVGWLFILSYEYSYSLLVPILIHSIWDTKIHISIRILIVAIVALYFIFEKKKAKRVIHGV